MKSYLLPNTIYDAQEVVEIANDAYHRGLLDMNRLNSVAAQHLNLIKDIIIYASCCEGQRLETMLLNLAEIEAGHRSINALASELLKRLDHFNLQHKAIFRNGITEGFSWLVEDTKAVREALLKMASKDNPDGGELLRSESIRNIAGRVAVWKRPDDWYKPSSGIAPERQWLAERVKIWRRQEKQSYYETGMAIYNEIARKPYNERSAEEVFAFNKLDEYVREIERDYVAGRSKMSDYLRKLLSHYKKKRDK